MRKLVIALLVSSALAVPPARAQTEYRNQPRRYSTHQVLTILGKRHTPSPGNKKLFEARVHAGVKTSLDCGRLRVNFDLSGLASSARDIQDALQSIDPTDVLGMIPMLALCQSSPSLCAEIKNLNFQINERLKGLTDICRSMDSYLDKQATKGKALAFERCVRDEMANGAKQANAQIACDKKEAENKLLFTDIAQGWVENVTTDAEQEILGRLLQATGHKTEEALGSDTYAFLSSVLGEVKLDVNGKLIPVFPAQPKTVAHLAKQVGARAIEIACNPTDLADAARGTRRPNLSTDPPERMWQNHMFDVIQQKIDAGDARNLEDLDQPDREAACNALGRAIARATLERLADHGEAIMIQALENPALDLEIREAYESRSSRVFSALRTQRFEGSQHSIEELLRIIEQMAELVRETNRRTGAAVSRGQIRMKQEMERTACQGAYTCEDEVVP